MSGIWSIDSTGGIYTYYASNSGTTNRTIAGTASWTNYSAEAKFKVTSWLSTGKMGILTRATDVNNYYNAYYNYSNKKLLITKRVGGTNTTIATSALTYTLNPDTYYIIKMDVNGSSLTASILDTNRTTLLTVSGTDTALTTGKVGVYTDVQTGYFDDVMVK